MTIAEIERAIDSKKRMQKAQAQEKASFDYILADLIGKSISRIYSSTNEMPDIAQVYPTLFNTEDIEQAKAEKQAELSVARFKQFAKSFNSKFNKEVAKG